MAASICSTSRPCCRILPTGGACASVPSRRPRTSPACVRRSRLWQAAASPRCAGVLRLCSLGALCADRYEPRGCDGAEGRFPRCGVHLTAQVSGWPGCQRAADIQQALLSPRAPPSIAGGGTVDYVGPVDHDFIHDIEAREKAGTPGILQTLQRGPGIRGEGGGRHRPIEQREARDGARGLCPLGCESAASRSLAIRIRTRRVGIVSFNIKDPKGQYLHPRLITTLLNDLFGIQSRAGCSCAGPYGHQLLGIDEHKGRGIPFLDHPWLSWGQARLVPGGFPFRI